MPSSRMWFHVALVRTEVSEELIASAIMVTRTDELGTTLAVTSNGITIVFLRSLSRLLVTVNVVPSSQILVTPMMKMIRSSEMSGLTRATQRNIPEDAILHSHRRENLKCYILRVRTLWTKNLLLTQKAKQNVSQKRGHCHKFLNIRRSQNVTSACTSSGGASPTVLRPCRCAICCERNIVSYKYARTMSRVHIYST
jgi:hypothetical protein